MIDDIQTDAEERMDKALEALAQNFNKIRTGRAHPVFLTESALITTGQKRHLSRWQVSMLKTPAHSR